MPKGNPHKKMKDSKGKTFYTLTLLFSPRKKGGLNENFIVPPPPPKNGDFLAATKEKKILLQQKTFCTKKGKGL